MFTYSPVLVNRQPIGHAWPVKLSKELIVDAAMAVLQDEGLAAVNMRAIAARLQVRASALYRHFPAKENILGTMSKRIFAQAHEGLSDDVDWSGWLLQFGVSLRASLLRHRDSAILCTSAPPPAQDAHAARPSIAAPLTSRGVAEGDALSEIASVIAFTVGMTAYQQSEAYSEYLEEMLGFDRSFTKGLHALVSGFREAQG